MRVQRAAQAQAQTMARQEELTRQELEAAERRAQGAALQAEQQREAAAEEAERHAQENSAAAREKERAMAAFRAIELSAAQEVLAARQQAHDEIQWAPGGNRT